MGKNLSSIILDTSSQVWCMLKLNEIIYKSIKYNLIAIGFGDGKICIINILTMEVHQILKNTDEVYSLTQFKEDSKFLICSLSDGKLQIFILRGNKYELHQTLKKPDIIDRGEINKVIALSDGNLATAERGAISFWNSIKGKKEMQFEFFKEIETGEDTCQLLEINPQFIACAMYSSKTINVYKKNGDNFLLHGKIEEAESSGNNSNSMEKINQLLFCSGGKTNIYIVSVEPVQIIQKILFEEEDDYNNIQFILNSNDGFIFTSFDNKIMQFKIIQDEEGNFIRLKKFGEINAGLKNRAIITFENGKIFYKKNMENSYEKSLFILDEYKIIGNKDFHFGLNKYIDF